MGDLAELQARIDATDGRFMAAFNAGDIAGAARAAYTRDATLMPPGAPAVRGLEDIVGFWTAAAPALGVERVQLSTVSLTPAGDLVCQIGRAVLTIGGQDAVGKYVVLWKEEDGELRWHVDIWNMDA